MSEIIQHETIHAIHASEDEGVFGIYEDDTGKYVVRGGDREFVNESYEQVSSAIEAALHAAEAWDRDWEDRNWTKFSSLQREVLRCYEDGAFRNSVSSSENVDEYDPILFLALDLANQAGDDRDAFNDELELVLGKAEEIYYEILENYSTTITTEDGLTKPQTFIKDEIPKNSPAEAKIVDAISQSLGDKEVGQSIVTANARIEMIMDQIEGLRGVMARVNRDCVDDVFEGDDEPAQMLEHMRSLVRQRAGAEEFERFLPQLEKMFPGSDSTPSNPSL